MTCEYSPRKVLTLCLRWAATSVSAHALIRVDPVRSRVCCAVMTFDHAAPGTARASPTKIVALVVGAAIGVCALFVAGPATADRPSSPGATALYLPVDLRAPGSGVNQRPFVQPGRLSAANGADGRFYARGLHWKAWGQATAWATGRIGPYCGDYTEPLPRCLHAGSLRLSGRQTLACEDGGTVFAYTRMRVTSKQRLVGNRRLRRISQMVNIFPGIVC